MSDPSSSLFREVTHNDPTLLAEIKQHALRHTFSLHHRSVMLTLTDRSILLQETEQQYADIFCLQLGFDVKFTTVYQQIPRQSSPGIPIAIKLERENCKEELTFSSAHPAIAESWSLELEKKINQRNFHSLFKAKKKIGKGAFATVYLAQRLRDHKMVAVKAFSKERQYSSDKGRESLENQIKLMRRLNHSNVSKLEGVYQTENSIYVILEYLEGKQLNEILKSKKKIESSEARQIIQHILRGINHLDQHRIIHRDLKPQNIIFRKQNGCDLAICDFGLATHADQEQYLFVRCGTPGFVAPEIINIRDMSTKSQPISDIFSVGIIFHYLLFGCSIFQGTRYNQILQQNRNCIFNFDRDIYSSISYKAFDLLTKMLEKDPSRRISSEKALIHPFFIDMDIQYQPKNLSRSVPLTQNLFSSGAMDVESLTSSARMKKDEKYFNFKKVPEDK